MQKYFVVSLVLCATVLCFGGEWISLTDTCTNCAERSMVNSKGDLTIDFKTPGYNVDTVNINGKDYASINLDETSTSLEKGAPELRSISAFVAVPGCRSVAIEVRNALMVERGTNPIIPSKGNLTRDVNPAEIPYEFGPAYQKAGWYPENGKLVSVSEPFKMRDIWGVRVTVTPFQYNHKEKKLRIYTEIQVALKPVGVSKALDRSPACQSDDFETLYSRLFLNYQKRSVTPPAVAKKLLIITHDDFVAPANLLKDWKTQQGYAAEVVKVSAIGTTADSIKTYLQQRFDAGNLCFVTLIGDSQHIPTLKGKNENADSDPCYVKLAGNDNVPDAFICRISGENLSQIEYMIQRSINFEQNPSQGADGAWYKQALGIASAQGDPTDFARIDELNAALKADLGFTKISTCYDTSYYGGADKKVIFDACKDGVSLINYCGHGSVTSWGTSGFSVSDCAKLENNMKLPVVWSVACVNGQVVGKTWFAEAWLRAGSKDKPAGCLTFAGASTNMAWVPPCVWIKEIITEQTCKKKNDIILVQHKYGILKTMEEYGVEDKKEGNQLFEQTHI
ncbi:MAG: C25 family cysteine peptidase, partial [Candidatus Wallbacteria bacterium]|nr:C25 family cysteine peptidase [Candidatus Wallbacteria bacterium]